MSLAILIPVKPFEEAKSRLAPALSPCQRRVLAASLFRRTLGVALDFTPGRNVLVATRSREAASIAQSAGAGLYLEPDGGGLNATLRDATAHAFARGATAVLCLPTDLPLLQIEDIAALARLERWGYAIAPNRARDGTNALLWHGPQLPRFSFGADSFNKHLTAMRGQQLDVSIVSRPGLSLDLDTEADLAAWGSSLATGTPFARQTHEPLG